MRKTKGDVGMRISMWNQIYDKRYNGSFKIRDLESVKLFMSDCLCKGQEYIIPDVNNPKMYYTLEKNNGGHVLFAHTEYGPFNLKLMQHDGVDKKIYSARKSINAFFFKEND